MTNPGLSDAHQGTPKTCFKCQETKPRSEFYAHPMMADGLLGKCKECAKRDVRDNYRGDPAGRHEYEQERAKKPERRAKQRAYNAKARSRNFEKTKARYAVCNAVRDGRLVAVPCEVCGSVKVQAHHEDYSKPLDVRWLCFRHHRQAHGQSNIFAPSDRIVRKVTI